MTSPSPGTDTIAAIATPPGRGGIGIVRVSGPASAAITRAVAGELPPPRRAAVRPFRDGDGALVDEGLVLWFPAPHSFTGEDVLELHGHGGPVVLDLLMARVLALGARPARPGEFSQRAFLNDRLDLAQAEAVADLIDSGSAQAARAAMRSLRGELSRRVDALVEQVIELRTHVEAAIDFPEEEIDFLADAAVARRLDALQRSFDELQRAAGQGRLLRDGMTVVLAGAPNAGKSSLLNRLAGYDAAIVTGTPGTTRDVLRERIELDGMPLHVIDTAGLRAGGDEVEREGMRRAQHEMARADRVLLIVDASTPRAPHFTLPDGVPVTTVRNKIDLTGEAAGVDEDSAAAAATARISAKTGAGLARLRAHLARSMGYVTAEAGVLSARRRHLDALARARAHVDEGRRELEARRAGELLAEELRLAQQALAEITGEFTSDDLLGRIFASFCIGK